MSRKRVLFVDDEQEVLEGLRNLLRRNRHEWDMVFALGGYEALAELSRGTVDVVVTDMRMPGMDGAQLLAQVKTVSPSTARLVLSGHAEKEAILRALPVAHQFLSKPCGGGTLLAALRRTCEVQTALDHDGLRRVVGGLGALPSPPRIYELLTEVANRPGSAVADLAKVVESDPSMSTKVLQLVNSSYFGRCERVTSIPRAVSHLGVALLKGLALTSEVFGALVGRPVHGFSLEAIQRRSFLAARIARRLPGESNLAEEAATAALLHSIGSIVIALAMPDEYEAMVRATEAGRERHLAEVESVGATHAAVGAYLMGVWGLPFSIVESVAFHQSPGNVVGGSYEVLAAVHVATKLAESESACLDLSFLEQAGFAAHLDRWRSIAHEEVVAEQKAC